MGEKIRSKLKTARPHPFGADAPFRLFGENENPIGEALRVLFGVRDEKGLKAALEEIDQLEKTTLDRTVYQRWREYFAPFLMLGSLLVFLAVSLQMSASRRLA